MKLNEVMTSGRGEYNDAMLATTASGHADVLVTEDSKLVDRVQVSKARCAVWGFVEFEQFVSEQHEAEERG